MESRKNREQDRKKKEQLKFDNIIKALSTENKKDIVSKEVLSSIVLNIDLDQSKIDALAEALAKAENENNIHLLEIDFSACTPKYDEGNELNLDGLIASLQQCRQLKKLNLAGLPLSSDNITQLNKALTPRIVSDKTNAPVAIALPPNYLASSLETLNLSACQLEDKHIEKFVLFLRHNTKLRNLILKDNQISENGAIFLAKKLENYPNRLLLFKGNYAIQIAADDASRGLNKTLTVLSLAGNPAIPEHYIKNIATAIQKNRPQTKQTKKNPEEEKKSIGYKAKENNGASAKLSPSSKHILIASGFGGGFGLGTGMILAAGWLFFAILASNPIGWGIGAGIVVGAICFGTIAGAVIGKIANPHNRDTIKDAFAVAFDDGEGLGLHLGSHAAEDQPSFPPNANMAVSAATAKYDAMIDDVLCPPKTDCEDVESHSENHEGIREQVQKQTKDAVREEKIRIFKTLSSI